MNPSTSPVRHYGRPILLLSALLCGLSSAHAAVLAYEGFDYTPGSQITGQSGGTGWGGSWIQQADAGGTEIISTGSLASVNSGYNAASAGNSATLNAGHRVARLLDTSAGGTFGAAGYLDGSSNIGADGTSLYLSFTLSETSGNNGGYYEVVFNRDDLGDGGRIAGVGDDLRFGTINLRTAGDQTPIMNRDTNVNLFVLRIDYAAGNDTVSVWANPTGSTLGAPGLQVQNSDMSFDGISFAAFNDSNSIHVDELRFGTTADSVLPVPEPSALALLGLGAGAALTARRRRRI
jgi:hypothetical protein